MVNIKNVSPMGDLDVPLLGRDVKRGEVVEVSPEHAERLLLQGDVWQPVDVAPDPAARPSDSAKKAAWVAHAEHWGIEGAADMTKPELMAATVPAVVENLDGSPVPTDEHGFPMLRSATDGDEGEDNDSIDAGSDASETKGE